MRANIIKDIRHAKEQLRYKAHRKGGVYENFGQKEYLKLKDKFSKYKGLFGEETDKRIDELLAGFFEWCISRDDKNIQNMGD